MKGVDGRWVLIAKTLDPSHAELIAMDCRLKLPDKELKLDLIEDK